jgi:hypothetical protein
MMILVAGPYRSGTDDPKKMAANVRAMEAYALPLFRAGHVPVVGEWLALPLVALAGSRRVGDEPFNDIFTRLPNGYSSIAMPSCESVGLPRVRTRWCASLANGVSGYSTSSMKFLVVLEPREGGG